MTRTVEGETDDAINGGAEGDTGSETGDRADPQSGAVDERTYMTEHWTRILGWLLTICGAVALAAAAVLSIEKVEMLTAKIDGTTFSPSCNFNRILSCGSVMESDQASVFGFPNPFMGIAGFAVFVTIGVGILAGARFAPWFWIGAQLGITFAVGFVHWLIWQSLFEIEKLCPYCMVVWAMTIAMFLFVTIRNLHAFGLADRSRVARVITRAHAPILMVWIFAIVVLIVVVFWSDWVDLYS